MLWHTETTEVLHEMISFLHIAYSALKCQKDQTLRQVCNSLQDANVLLQDEEGRTPLHLCAGRPDPASIDCVRILLVRF